jgi:two-component system chemotaxis response regulator CheB
MERQLLHMKSNPPFLNLISKEISEQTGLVFQDADQTGLLNKLQSRALSLGFSGLEAYQTYYQNHRDLEKVYLVSLFTTHHTFFFREFVHFEILEKDILEKLKMKENLEITLWTAACSSGQEAYSLSCFLHRIKSIHKGFQYQIFASDIDQKSVATAKNGVYPTDQIKKIPAHFLSQNWIRGTAEIINWYKASNHIKKPIQFFEFNLIKPGTSPITKPLDYIFCRNVFLYFTKTQISTAMAYFEKRLAPDGKVFLGVSESIETKGTSLISLGSSIYGKQKTGATSHQTLSQSHLNPLTESQSSPIKVIVIDDSPTILSIMQKILTLEQGFQLVAKGKTLADARLAIMQHKADVLCLDLNLEKETGLEYLESISVENHIPVVIVSAMERDHSKLAQRALELGAKDYVEKPQLAELEKMGEELRIKLRAAHKASKQSPMLSNTKPLQVSPIPSAKPKNSKVRVLVVDDSKMMASLLSKLIESHPQLEVAGTVTDPREALQAIESLKPHILTVDVHMPHLNGAELIRQISQSKWLPCLLVSSLTLEQGNLVLQALEWGAVDYIQKPELSEISQFTPVFHEKLLEISTAQQQQTQATTRLKSPWVAGNRCFNQDHLVLLGASTGGTQALAQLIESLPSNMPPVLIVQHIPPVFSKAFAQRIGSQCHRPAVEVTQRSPLVPGTVYVASGGQQLRVEKGPHGLEAVSFEGPKHSGHCPSVDLLFESASKLKNVSIVAALLTGMGKDGAQGLLKLRQTGATTLSQSERTCVVWGMPRAAEELGASQFVEDLENIPKRILFALENASRTKVAC